MKLRLISAPFLRTTFVALCVAAALGLTPARALERVFPDIKVGGAVESFTLENGLDVVVIPDRRAPVVTHMIWYKAGSADEPRGASGIAHYLEHLMFKGTKLHPAGAFSKTVAAVGGEENAFTSYDYTAYYQRVAKEHLKTMMSFEADRMTNLVLTNEMIKAELKVVLEERAQRTDNDPGSQLGETLNATLFSYSPYGIPVIGWENEIRNLDVDDALNFYERFYTPNNAVLIVAGDVSIDEVRALTAETWAKVPRRFETEPRIRQEEPVLRGERAVTYKNPLVRQASVRRAWVVPSSRTAVNDDSEALEVLGVILGSGATSRIYKSLVIEQKLASYAGAGYGGTALGDTQFVVYGAPADGKTNDEVLAAITAEIEKLIKDGVSDEEMRLAKKSLISDAFFAQDSQTSLARIFGSELATGATIENIQTWPSRVEAVTKDRVIAAARKYLLSPEAVTGYLLPDAANEKS